MDLRSILREYRVDLPDEVINGFVERRYNPNEAVFMEGDESEKFYVILSGEVSATRKGASNIEEFLYILKKG